MASSGSGCTAVSAHFMVCIKDINCNAETRLNLFYILAVSQHHARYRPNFITTENELYPTCIYYNNRGSHCLNKYLIVYYCVAAFSDLFTNFLLRTSLMGSYWSVSLSALHSDSLHISCRQICTFILIFIFSKIKEGSRFSAKMQNWPI